MTAVIERAPAHRLADVRAQFMADHQPENLCNQDLLAVREALILWRSIEARIKSAEDSRVPNQASLPLCGWGPLTRDRQDHPETVASPLWAIIEDLLTEDGPETLLGQSEDMARERRAWDALFLIVATVRNSRHPDLITPGGKPLSGWGPHDEHQRFPGLY
jgi:hypothetical protein